MSDGVAVDVVGDALVIVGGRTCLVLQAQDGVLVVHSGLASMLEVEALLRLAAPHLAALVVSSQESRNGISLTRRTSV